MAASSTLAEEGEKNSVQYGERANGGHTYKPPLQLKHRKVIHRIDFIEDLYQCFFKAMTLTDHKMNYLNTCGYPAGIAVVMFFPAEC